MSDEEERRAFRDRDRDVLSRFEQLSPVSPNDRLNDDDVMGQGQQGYIVGDFGSYKAPRRQAAKPYDRPTGRLKKVKLVRDMESEEFKEYVVLWVKGAVFYNGLAVEAHTVREETMWGKTADRYVEARGMHVSYVSPDLASDYWSVAAEYVDSVRNHGDDPGRVGLRRVGKGSYNQYYHILRPDSGLTPLGRAQWVAIRQLMDEIGYEEWEYTLTPEERHARSLGPGRLPFGIGVRIQRKDLKPSMVRAAEEGEIGHKRVYGEGKVFGYDAAITGLFAEMYVTMMMASHGLAPPVIATALVQDKDTEAGARVPFQIRAVTISANVEMSLDGLFDKIKSEHGRGDYYSPERVAWLEALGTEISRVLAETSHLRVLLLDIKPDNMLYSAEGPPDAPELSKTHRVYMTDFDTKFTVVFPPDQGFSPMDGGCIEMLNTLLFLNFINCWHDFHDYGHSPVTYPILGIVARPIRARLRALAHGVDVLNADGTSSNPLLMESHLCKLLSSLPLPMDRANRPILYTGSRQYPDRARIEKIAHSFMEMAWHYGEHRNRPLENKCWPYKREGSLILQMYRYLSEYRDSAERDGYEGDSMRRREPRGPSVAACQLDGVSVVDEVFARMGM